MYVASVAKQLVAVLAAQQVLAAQLHSEDRVIDLLPALPTWAAAIRVRHLIHHTSGLPATARVLAAVGGHEEQHLTNALVLHGLRCLSGADAPAGSAFVYSNVGYIVLAEIVCTVAATPLPDLAHRALFAPLGMTASRLATEQDEDVTKQTRPPRTLGDGGLWTSASDLLTWLDALNHDGFGADLTRLVQTPGRLDDGTPLSYAWGVTAHPGPAGTTYTHGGNWPGWSAKTIRRPATRTAVALLTTSNDVDAVSRAAVYLHEQLPVSS